MNSLINLQQRASLEPKAALIPAPYVFINVIEVNMLVSEPLRMAHAVHEDCDADEAIMKSCFVPH